MCSMVDFVIKIMLCSAELVELCKFSSTSIKQHLYFETEENIFLPDPSNQMPLNAMLDHYIAAYKSTAGRRSFVISSHNCTHYNANFMMLEFEMQHSVELLDSFDFGLRMTILMEAHK